MKWIQLEINNCKNTQMISVFFIVYCNINYLFALVFTGFTIAKRDTSLSLPGASLIDPPDATALLVHDWDNVGGAIDRVEVDDWVVPEAKLGHVLIKEVKVVLVPVLVHIADSLGTPFLKNQKYDWKTHRDPKTGLVQYSNGKKSVWLTYLWNFNDCSKVVLKIIPYI